MLGSNEITNFAIVDRIDKAVADNQSKLYKPRSGKVNGNLGLYSKDQLAYIL